MDGGYDLKAEYREITGFVRKLAPDTDQEKLKEFIMACILRVWGSNGLYAPAYEGALNDIFEETFTPEQIMTAMACCSDGERQLFIPEFFISIVKRDAKYRTSDSRTFIDMLARFLAGAAFVNGDFTMKEADAVNCLSRQLSEYATNKRVKNKPMMYNAVEHITPEKQESYWHKAPEEREESAADEARDNSGAQLTETTQNKQNNTSASNEPTADETVSEDIRDDGTSATVKKPEQEASPQALSSVLEELDNLVGLESVKSDVHSLLNFIKVCRMREQRGFKVPTISYHLVFTGNPGTGKTTVARLVAQIYHQMGLLSQGQLVETDRSALIAGYLGQTAIKVQKVIQQAIGGVLFIDEAYSLVNDTDDSYGKEAIETLLKMMEDHRDELVVIVAGYDALMHKFIDSNPGLRSRFNKYFHFPDYTGIELTKIFLRFCENNGYYISPDLEKLLNERFEVMYESREEHFGNARTVRNLFEKAINHQANRIALISELSDDDLMGITKDDIDKAFAEVG